jgi:hypothetical protein
MHIKYIKIYFKLVLIFLFGKSLLLSTLNISIISIRHNMFKLLAIYQFASELKYNKYLIFEWNFFQILKYFY